MSSGARRDVCAGSARALPSSSVMRARNPRSRFARRVLLAAFVLAAGPGVVTAQVRAPNETEQEDSSRLSADSLARLDTIRVETIRIDGNSVFTPAELAALTSDYEQRSVSLEELHELRQALTQAYVARGYVNSGVVIPDQRITDGVVVLHAIEGELTELTIEGNRRWRERAIASRLRHDVAVPLNIEALQASLQRLEEDPLVARINAELLPGEVLGQSELRLGLTEEPPLTIAVAASNDRSTNVGEDRGTLGLAYRGLIGNGDVLTGRFGFTEGVDDNLLSYRVPITPRGATLELALTDQQTDIVEEPFDRIDITSDLESFGLTASYPFRRRYESTLTGIFGIEHRRSESTLLGLPFSFSPGDVEGRARGSSVLAGLEWTERRPAMAFTLRGTVQTGIDAFDATQHASAADSDFVALLGQFQFLRNFAERDSRLLARSVVQIANDPLLAMYKIPVGGRHSVRGYRESQHVRDNAFIGSVEYQLPPLRDDAGQPRGNVYVAVFADYGLAWDEDERLATSDKDGLAAVGIGVLWDPTPRLHAELYYGFDLDDQGNPESALQDKGIHYGLSFERRL